MKQDIIQTTSFPLLMGSLALMILGLALSPLLKVKLLPDRSLPSVSVYYNYGGANALAVDSEVTSRLEAVFSRLEGLVKLRSRTGDGNGVITLEMEKEADMDAVRFEVSTLTRQVYPELPAGVSYPQIRVSRPDEDERVEQLMSLVVNGPDRRWEMGQVAETGIKPVLSLIEGVTEVRVSGYTPQGWELVYDAGKLKNLRLEPEALSRQIREYYKTAELGMARKTSQNSLAGLRIPVMFTGRHDNTPRWEEMIIRAGERLFPLTDLVDVRQGESPASGYYRINGLNTITIGILAAKSANQLVVAGKIKEELEWLREKLPAGYSLELVYDSTVFLKDELFKTGIRIGLSLLLLLVFVWLVSRSRRYLFVMFAGMTANILTAFIIYYLAGIEIHLYSLAGITISLGMIIDNTIVMADHIRTGKGISIFRGILAATLTTMGALVAVFFYRGTIFTVVFLILAAAVVVFGQIKKKKFPVFGQSEAISQVDWNRNITVEENQKRIKRFLSLHDPLLECSSCLIGPQDFLLDRTAGQGASEAQLYIRARTEEDLALVTARFKSDCRKSYPEAVILVAPPPNLFEKVFNSRSAPLEIRLKNRTGEGLPSPDVIRKITSEVTRKTGILVKDPLRLQDYFMIVPDHERLLLYRVSFRELISVLKKAFNQLQIFTLNQGQSQVPVFLSGRDQSLDQVIRSTQVKSERGQDIPVSSLVSIRENIDYKELQGGKSGIFVALDYDARQKQSKAITRAYREVLKSYPGIDMEVKGSLLDNITLLKEMTVILLVSLLLLYLILAAQFESLLQPLIVLIEIPVNLGGALIVLWLTGNSLNLMAFIGLIVITGIVINDSILKIDTINRLVKGNLPVMEAIHLGGTRRLKPIIMTSATTILAMIPLFFSDDLGSRLQQPLGIVVIAGMTIGTLVSLYVVPLCYYYLIKIRNRSR